MYEFLSLHKLLVVNAEAVVAQFVNIYIIIKKRKHV